MFPRETYFIKNSCFILFHSQRAGAVLVPLGTNKTSQFMVLNEDMYLLLNENLCKQRDPHPQIEFNFDKKHIHYNVCGAKRRPL